MPDLLNDDALNPFDGFGRKGFAEHVFTLFGLMISEEAERRLIFVEAFVQSFLLIPTVLRIVDVMICLWLGKVQLFQMSIAIY